ncbi:MAG: hypothetical protein WA461_04935, partial [Nitrososphaeraceae archaeon]
PNPGVCLPDGYSNTGGYLIKELESEVMSIAFIICLDDLVKSWHYSSFFLENPIWEVLLQRAQGCVNHF